MNSPLSKSLAFLRCLAFPANTTAAAFMLFCTLSAAALAVDSSTRKAVAGNAKTDVAPRNIQWHDLAPENGKPFIDPFSKLSDDQLVDLGYVMRVRRLIASEKISASGHDAKEAETLAANLHHQGIDIPWLMVQRQRVQQVRGQQVKALANSVGESLRDQTVSLAGYVIPSETDSDGRLKEFFLVPTPAACSHEDPPPRLQVVFVSTKQGIDVPGKRIPVRVTGKITAETASRTTVNASGRLMVHSAYAMSSPEITVFRQAENQTTHPNRDR